MTAARQGSRGGPCDWRDRSTRITMISADLFASRSSGEG